jgi:spermidine synthase
MTMVEGRNESEPQPQICCGGADGAGFDVARSPPITLAGTLAGDGAVVRDPERTVADDGASSGVPAGARRAVGLFVLTSFLGSSLLFMVQPMVAKMLLPSLGGTPSVWNTSMVFFQVTLVAGYGLAHVGMRLLTPRRQRFLQVAALVVPIAVLPVALPGGWEPPVEGSPAGWLLVSLFVMIGGPFLMLSTSSPTLQHWFATGRGTQGRDPYFLYAAGNSGSLLALLAYPVVIEPQFSLEGQARLFSIGYVALVLLSALCAARGPGRGARSRPIDPAADTEHPAVSWSDRRRWIAWSFVPSALLLGVTRHLSTDVMSVPMMWVAPLALYLLTYIIAFGRHPDRSVRIGSSGLQLAVVALTLPLLGVLSSLVAVIVLHLAVFFLAALLGHSRLAQSRPAPSHLTEFYLMISIGGALGGAVTALLAPLVFETVIEYPLAIVAALAMCPAPTNAGGWRSRLDARSVASVAAVAGVMAFALAMRTAGEPRGIAIAGLFIGVTGIVALKVSRTPRAFASVLAVLLGFAALPVAGTLVTTRSFFGVSRIQTDPNGHHLLVSGSTIHGIQDIDGDDPLRALTYYHPAGPIGQHLTSGRPDAPIDVGIVGLGAGTLVGYGRAGDRFTYYEIDPAVVRIAQDPRYFSYLSETPAEVTIILGDGRLSLARSRSGYDTLILDAFSSDAIPVHLLTEEAFATYLDHLRPGGVIAVHISNRYFDLEPVLTRTAMDLDLAGVIQNFHPSDAQLEDTAYPSRWIFLARDESALEATLENPGSRRLDPANASPAWTDSFSNTLGALDL